MGDSLVLNTAYTFEVTFSIPDNTMSVSLNNMVIAENVAVTTNNIAPDAFRIYSMSGSNIEVDNILISAIPEPSTVFLGGLGVLALLRRRR